MSEIYVKENESLDNALKRFKRSCAKAGVMSDLRRKEYYQSPSVRRRNKSEAARKNKNKRYYSCNHKILHPRMQDFSLRFFSLAVHTPADPHTSEYAPVPGSARQRRPSCAA